MSCELTLFDLFLLNWITFGANTEEVDISWERWSKKKHHMMHVNWPKKITSKCNSHPLCRIVGPNISELHSTTKCLMVCKALGLQVLVLSASLSFWWRNNCNSYQSVKWLISQYSCVPYDQVRFLTFLKFQSQNTSLELLLSTQ